MENTTTHQKTVVVLGLARSGTSMAAGILKILGVDMGQSVSDKANPKGSLEDRDFARVHKEIFTLMGRDKNYWNPPTPEALLSVKEQLSQKIWDLVQKKSKEKAIWGWKHPRTILTIDLFLPYLVSPHFVVVFRNPLAIAKSTVRHTANYERPVTLIQALKLTSFYYGELVKFLDNCQESSKIFIDFEQLAQSPVEEAGRLAEFLGLELTDGKITEIEGFVVPRGRMENERKVESAFQRRLLHFIKMRGR